uniref:Uncharacterized protein n=1 Tax=Anguilla anguilla TaxID=7936 RepID=A0A0E9RJJ9_ANGAN
MTHGNPTQSLHFSSQDSVNCGHLPRLKLKQNQIKPNDENRLLKEELGFAGSWCFTVAR